jgi:hypothetical protein
VPYFARVPTVAAAPTFIAELAGLVETMSRSKSACLPGDGHRICPKSYTGCPIQ